MQTSAIFPLFYLPPISCFSAYSKFGLNLLFEQHEHFPKQTFRNRASISSPNGMLDLIIPVVKGSKVHTPYRDVKISQELKWQRLHWLSLQNCYRSAAYFEYYEDGIAPFYEKKYNFLFDYNLQLLEWLFKQLKMTAAISFTAHYQKNGDHLDLRDTFNKKDIYQQETKRYFQVFSDRNPFISNLSILDLLFNQGPQSRSYF